MLSLGMAPNRLPRRAGRDYHQRNLLDTCLVVGGCDDIYGVEGGE